jgi:hypothetical protein
MKQLALAFHMYTDKHGKFPRNITDANGKPLQSWRVALLPYLEQNNLPCPWRPGHGHDSQQP